MENRPMILPNPQNSIILSQYLETQAKKELKKKSSFAEDLVNETEVRRIVFK